MKKQLSLSAALLGPALLSLMPAANAAIIGTTGTTGGSCPAATRCFALTARVGYIATGDGNSMLVWGYSDDDHPIYPTGANGSPDSSQAPLVQYPGPTLIVNQDDAIQITLKNALRPYPAAGGAAPPVSMIFPGQIGVAASGGAAGLLTQEATASQPVVYKFSARKPGTYTYGSGSDPELQVEMGLTGALIVRPVGFDAAANKTAYGGAGSAYDREYLFFLTEMDRNAHELVDQGLPVKPAEFKETLWFLNGRNGPDTMLLPQVGHMPSQPYNALVRQEPHERTLMRIIGAGRDMHPFHHHGNNAWLIAHDGRVLESAADATAPYPDKPSTKLPDQAISNYTIQTVPGNTYDAIWTWTGKGLNWDIYGDRPGHRLGNCLPASNPANLVAGEDPLDHCKPIPVTLPEQQQLAFGGFWSGSPYLGTGQPLPPLQGGLNPSSGYTFMWHSHTERELTNDDIFPGGMMTMMIVEAPGTLDSE